jgi:small subunit ribosomal protein S1
MAKRDILTEYGIDGAEVAKELAASLQGIGGEELERSLDESVRDYSINTILEGRVVSLSPDEAMVDVGYKSQGSVALSEWSPDETPQVGDTVEVLLEAVEDDSGLVQLSKAKADRIRRWEKVVSRHAEGDVVTGTVIRKIKGGLLVDIGVPVFLPASQVDIRRPGEIADFIGHRLTCKILKVDEDRRNIVVSRRQLIEAERAIMKVRMFERLAVGQIRPGKVKNIVDFGAFVDLGGIDGLLHITDMSWGRISHPSEMVAIDDLIEVVILNVDIQEEKVALGLKQKTPSPWVDIEEKYPVGSAVTGEVVNLMNYGAFVKLEEGVEGLVHISEMSWTRRISHPSELVSIGDMVDIVVLGINKEKEEISLGMKQTEQNPWELVEQSYPPGTEVVGRVRNLTNYGAFVEIEEGIDGLLHVSDMSWTRKVSHPSEVLQKGDTVHCLVLEVDPEKRRVALGLKQLETDPWEEEIPSRYRAGDLVRGVVTKLTSFGAFVELEDGLEGLLHISELSEKKIPSPEEIVDVGDVLDVRVIRVDTEGRKIGLSLRTEGPVTEREEQPRIVIRSDQLEEAENPEAVIQEALQEAPQLERDRDAAQPQALATGLGIQIPAVHPAEPAEPVAQAEQQGVPPPPAETAPDEAAAPVAQDLQAEGADRASAEPQQASLPADGSRDLPEDAELERALEDELLEGVAELEETPSSAQAGPPTAEAPDSVEPLDDALLDEILEPEETPSSDQAPAPAAEAPDLVDSLQDELLDEVAEPAEAPSSDQAPPPTAEAPDLVDSLQDELLDEVAEPAEAPSSAQSAPPPGQAFDLAGALEEELLEEAAALDEAGVSAEPAGGTDEGTPADQPAEEPQDTEGSADGEPEPDEPGPQELA